MTTSGSFKIVGFDDPEHACADSDDSDECAETRVKVGSDEQAHDQSDDGADDCSSDAGLGPSAVFVGQLAMSELESLRSESKSWSTVEFSPLEGSSGAFDANRMNRKRILLLLQYDRQPSDLELLRFLFTQQR